MSEKKVKLPQAKATVVFHPNVLLFALIGLLSDGEYDDTEFGDVMFVLKVALNIGNYKALEASGQSVEDTYFNMTEKDSDSLDLVYNVTHGNPRVQTHETAEQLCKHAVESVKAMFGMETKQFAKRPPRFAANMCVAIGEFESAPDVESIVASTPDEDVKKLLQRHTKLGGSSFCVRRLSGGENIRVVSVQSHTQ